MRDWVARFIAVLAFLVAGLALVVAMSALNEDAMPGPRGQRGRPGVTVVGPQGPQGPQGVPGAVVELDPAIRPDQNEP